MVPILPWRLHCFTDVPVGHGIPPAMTATDPDKAHRLEYSLDFSNVIVQIKGDAKTSPEYTEPARVRNSYSLTHHFCGHEFLFPKQKLGKISIQIVPLIDRRNILYYLLILYIILATVRKSLKYF